MSGVLRALLPAFVCALTIGAASAEAPATPNRWAGFYFGVNAGQAWADADFKTTPGGLWNLVPADAAAFQAATSKTLELDGFAPGVQVGYSAQINRMVFGFEVDLASVGADSRLTGAIAGTGITTRIQQAEMSWMATMRGRLGVAMDRLLIYGTGGLAIADWDVSIYLEGAGDEAFFGRSSIRTGWVAGAGFEYAFDSRWSLKGEYLVADFGSVAGASEFSGGGAGFTQQHDIGLSAQVGRIGLNFKY
jgi:outer membrane immunogenic protein